MKKKLLILPLIVALLIACMLPSIASEYDVSTNGVAVTDSVGAPGQEVRLQVSLPETFTDSMGIKFSVDSENMTMSEESSWLVEGKNLVQDVDVENGIGVWAVDEPVTLKGDIFEVVYVISEDAQIGDEYTVSCTVSASWNGKVERQGTATATVTVKNSAKLSGTVTSNGAAKDSVTVELLNSDSEVVATEVLVDGDNTYEFTVDQGEYIVRVSKTKHCTREYAVSMQELEDTVQDAKILLYGDVTQDGRVNTRDIGPIAKYITGRQSVMTDAEPYLLSVADVTGDGRVNTRDIGPIAKYITGRPSVFDSMP